jgi:hypothetical protein
VLNLVQLHVHGTGFDVQDLLSMISAWNCQRGHDLKVDCE